MRLLDTKSKLEIKWHLCKKMLFLKLFRIPIKTVRQAVINIQKDVQDLDVKIITYY